MPRETTDPDARVLSYVNKTVPFRFRGCDLRFHLSHALFSSFDIDDGTRLLLKTIARRAELDAARSVLDVGCGVGVIGACLGAAKTGAAVTMQDRDSLAVAFARENCRANGLPGIQCQSGLAFHGLGDARFDLVVSNLPAKAGAPVLRAFLRHAASVLTETGTVAVVVVSTLKDLIRDSIADMGGMVSYAEESPDYAVFHFQPGTRIAKSAEIREDISPYVRTRESFESHGVGYSIESVYSLPDFDTLGHTTELLLDMLDTVGKGTATLCWNPGQGHVGAWLGSRPGGSGGSLTLAGRDSLELGIAAHNARAAGWKDVASIPVPGEQWLADALEGRRLDLLCALPRPVPRVPWQAALADAARRLLAPGGRLVLAASSTEMHRFLEQAAGLRLVASRKRSGLRAAVLESPTPR